MYRSMFFCVCKTLDYDNNGGKKTHMYYKNENVGRKRLNVITKMLQW